MIEYAKIVFTAALLGFFLVGPAMLTWWAIIERAWG